MYEEHLHLKLTTIMFFIVNRNRITKFTQSILYFRYIIFKNISLIYQTVNNIRNYVIFCICTISLQIKMIFSFLNKHIFFHILRKHISKRFRSLDQSSCEIMKYTKQGIFCLSYFHSHSIFTIH